MEIPSTDGVMDIVFRIHYCLYCEKLVVTTDLEYDDIKLDFVKSCTPAA